MKKLAVVSPYIATSKSLEYYQSQQLNLAAELGKRGWHIDIITARRQTGELPRQVLSDRIQIIRLETPWQWQWIEAHFNQLWMSGLYHWLVSHPYDFIQSSEDCLLTTLSAALAALKIKGRLIIYQGIYLYSKSYPKRMLMRFFDHTAGKVIRRACRVALCKSATAAGFMAAKGYHTKVMPVGVNTAVFYPNRSNRNARRILTVGSLIPRKNYPLILAGFSRLLQSHPDCRLTIIGTGPEYGLVQGTIQKENLKDRIDLLESVPNAELKGYYSNAAFLLLMSKIEIFGMVLLEAMACGCPVISTLTAGAADVIQTGENGFILENETPDALAGLMAAILADRERLEEISQNALITARDHYAWPVIAAQYSAFLENELKADTRKISGFSAQGSWRYWKNQ